MKERDFKNGIPFEEAYRVLNAANWHPLCKPD
jgi:hypothetical protein